MGMCVSSSVDSVQTQSIHPDASNPLHQNASAVVSHTATEEEKKSKDAGESDDEEDRWSALSAALGEGPPETERSSGNNANTPEPLKSPSSRHRMRRVSALSPKGSQRTDARMSSSTPPSSSRSPQSVSPHPERGASVRPALERSASIPISVQFEEYLRLFGSGGVDKLRDLTKNYQDEAAGDSAAAASVAAALSDEQHLAYLRTLTRSVRLSESLVENSSCGSDLSRTKPSVFKPEHCEAAKSARAARLEPAQNVALAGSERSPVSPESEKRIVLPSTVLESCPEGCGRPGSSESVQGSPRPLEASFDLAGLPIGGSGEGALGDEQLEYLRSLTISARIRQASEMVLCLFTSFFSNTAHAPFPITFCRQKKRSLFLRGRKGGLCLLGVRNDDIKGDIKRTLGLLSNELETCFFSVGGC
jgi:hypothetical protein